MSSFLGWKFSVENGCKDKVSFHYILRHASPLAQQLKICAEFISAAITRREIRLA